MLNVAVQISEPEAEAHVEDEFQQPVRQFRAGVGRRMSGKMPSLQLPNSSASSFTEGSSSTRPPEDSSQPSHHHHRRQYYSEKLLAQVGEWLEHERKKAHRRTRRTLRRKSKSPTQEHAPAAVAEASGPRPRADSLDSQSSEISLDRLQRILEDSMGHLGLNSLPRFDAKAVRPKHRKTPSRGSMHRTVSSDTEYVDGDAIVPSCDAWLDNSKTLSYAGGTASTDDITSLSNKAEKEKEHWIIFKNEILRIAHTLRLKGWRRVPLGSGDSLSVERLSGALTNAVYVVLPPTDLPELEGKKPPAKLLLRIYGPQVEHLIDRENELQVLSRLARKKIGPRLLGTFQNGRFEQFFNAVTLTPADLRDPETSRQIAKRMRELHEGIDLLPHEKEAGAAVWKNWDQWQDNVEKIITFLDTQLDNGSISIRRDSVLHGWKSNGYVCGTPWSQFKEMVAKYRAHVHSCYANPHEVNNRLVFAHNDVSKA